MFVLFIGFANDELLVKLFAQVLEFRLNTEFTMIATLSYLNYNS